MDLERNRRLGRSHRGVSGGARALAEPDRFHIAGCGSARFTSSCNGAIPTRASATSSCDLPHEQAVELYDEVLERIQSNYVDPVPLEPLVATRARQPRSGPARPGLRQGQRAVGDPRAGELAARRPSPVPGAARRSRPGRRPFRLALSSSELAQQAIGMASTPVLLEFVCGSCDALDDFTSYLTPDKLEDLYAMIDGNFVGLGIELKIDPRGPALGRRDPRRPGLGSGPQSRRRDRQGRRPSDQGPEPRRGRQPLAGYRGNQRRPGRPSPRRRHSAHSV